MGMFKVPSAFYQLALNSKKADLFIKKNFFKYACGFLLLLPLLSLPPTREKLISTNPAIVT